MALTPIPEIPTIEAPQITATLNAIGETPTAPSTIPAAAPDALVDREPVVTTATIIGVLSSLVTWGVARGLLGQADEAFLVALVPATASVLFGYYGRRSATSTGRAKMAIDEAYAAEPGVGAKPTI